MKKTLCSILILTSVATQLQSKWTDYAPFKWFCAKSNNAQQENVNQAFMDAVRKNDTIREIVMLIEKGADVNYKDETGSNALMLAVLEKNMPLAKLLLEYKAEVEVKGNIIGLTPLILAVHNDDFEMAKMLLEAGATTDVKTEIGFNALMYAVLNKNMPITKLLLDYKANINEQESLIGLTPLLLAITNNDIEMVSFLLENNADPTIVDSTGQSALTYAEEQKSDAIITLIGSKINKAIEEEEEEEETEKEEENTEA